MDEAAIASGVNLLRLELATAHGGRRKPFGKNGNHVCMVAAAKVMQAEMSEESDFFSNCIHER